MAVPSLITLKKGEVISLREFTLPNIDTFLKALPDEDAELVFIASDKYTLENGYKILTEDSDHSFGLFGKVLFGSTTSTETAIFNSVKEYGNSFPCTNLKDFNKFYFNVTANAPIDSIYFDIVDAETRKISYTKITGEYTPLYFQVTNTQWEYNKGHNKSVIPIGIGSSSTVPNNLEYTWSPKLSEDVLALELYNGLKYSQLEIVSSVPQVSAYISLLANWESHQVVKVVVKNDLSNPIPAKKFTLTVRDIEDKTIYSVITFTYETEDLPVITHKGLEIFTENTVYGSGTTSVPEDKTLQFGFPRGKINNTDDVTAWIAYLESNEDIKYSPYYLVNSTGGKGNQSNSFFQSMHGGVPETGTLFNRPIIKYKPRITITNSDSQGMIVSQPIFSLKGHQQEPYVKGGRNVINLVTKVNLSTASGNTNKQSVGSVNLSSDGMHTIILDKKYPGFNMATNTYQEGNPVQGVDVLTATWDNEQSDIVELVPFINDDKQFCCKVIPTAIVDRAALVYVQLHNSAYWDNGKYIYETFRFNISPGTTSNVPLEVKEDKITMTAGEKYTFTVYSPSGAAITAKSSATGKATVDISKRSITAKQKGEAKITITATMAGYSATTKTIIVTVKDPLFESSLSVNRKTIVIDEGSTTQVKLTSERIDKVVFRHTPEQYVDVFTALETKDYCTNGVINIRGLTEGVEILSVVGEYRNTEEVIEDIEIHVIPKGTYKIIPKSSKIKVDLKKDRNGQKFWATTNAGFLRWELKEDETLFSVTGDPGTEYTDINILINPLVKGNTTLTLYGHDDVMGTRLVELEIPLKVTKNVEPGKNEIWVSAEHKQPGTDDTDIDFLDRRVFTVMKWLDRPTRDDIYGHTVYLPQRSGTLLTYKQLQDSNGIQKRYFDLAGKGYPTRNLNPKAKGYIYLDTTSGEIWKCIDNTKDTNHWFSMTGKQIGKPEQLIYPKPGQRGFGVGPMSYDLHEQYGLTPLNGTYDPLSGDYGNYIDKYGNRYVNIPKHYIKATGSVIDVEAETLQDDEDNNN